MAQVPVLGVNVRGPERRASRADFLARPMLCASPASRSRVALDGISREQSMKIVVIGGSGLIGRSSSIRLRRCGHEVVAASLASGVNIITGEGLAGPRRRPRCRRRVELTLLGGIGRSWTSSRPRAGTFSQRRRSAESGTIWRSPSSGSTASPTTGTFAPRLLRNGRLKGSGIPYTILRSTQFFEFIRTLIDSATVDRVAAGLAGALPAHLVGRGRRSAGRPGPGTAPRRDRRGGRARRTPDA